MDSDRILVAGATGYIGSLLLPRLRERGETVRCLARTPNKLEHLSDAQVEIVEANVLKRETLTPALRDVDTAYYLIHSMGAGGDFHERDITGARNFAEAADETGVNRIIYLGGLARDEGTELSEHLKSRQEVGRVLGSTGVPVTELRASIIIGSGSASFEIIQDLVDKLPLMITPKWVQSRCEPIAVDDVLGYLEGCLDEPETTGKTLEIGSGEVYTYADMMQVVAKMMGRSIYMIQVPVLTPRLSAYWLNLITSVPMQVAYPLVEGLRNDSYCTDRRIKSLIPRELATFREGLLKALNAGDGGRIESRWTAATRRADGELELDPDRVSDPLRDRQVIDTSARAEDLYRIVSRIGGETGYYYADGLWRIRGLLDRLVGGPGLRRGRRDPVELRAGDAVDFWRVEDVEAGRYIRFRSEMKLPGTAWLEFTITPEPGKSAEFRQEATFAVTSFWGYVYWFLLLPVHLVIFRNMARQIVHLAEEGGDQGDGSNTNDS